MRRVCREGDDEGEAVAGRLDSRGSVAEGSAPRQGRDRDVVSTLQSTVRSAREVVSHPGPSSVSAAHHGQVAPEEDERRIRMLQAFAELFAEGMSEVRLEGYLAALEDVPTDALAQGLRQASRACQFFPKPSEIRAAVDTALATDRVLAKARAQVVDDEDWRVAHSCTVCADSGMAYSRKGTRAIVPHSQVTGSHADWEMRLCVCRDRNPVIQQRCTRGTRYGVEETRG